jgi:two-component system, NtrC family, response regulator
MKPTLLIVDDDAEIRTQMKWALGNEYEVVSAEDRASAVSAYKKSRPIAVLLDLGLPPQPNDTTEGMAILRELLNIDNHAKIIVISGQGKKQNALEAVGAGAYDFLCKPIDVEELKFILSRCVYVAKLEAEFREMQRKAPADVFENMLGTSPQMQGVFAFIRKVAATTAPVILLGESGTGKEMAALAIHRRSPRKDGPFIAINCNAIPENLLESELFGHEKGSFTGAHTQRKGLMENAGGGTLFLDEIGELPMSIQVKLLRFLQDQRFQRVGGRQEIQIDTRIITATNVDLKQAVANGKFREDLYFRLAVVVLKLPALRDRGDDVDLLARSFLQQSAVQCEKKVLNFTPDAVRAIRRHAWPGNVRELQNRVKRAVIMAEGRRIAATDLELGDATEFTAPTTLKEARESVEREFVEKALKRNSGRISSAAAELGISRPTLYELMEKLGIGAKASDETPKAETLPARREATGEIGETNLAG